jgi:general secretion pathway protein D
MKFKRCCLLLIILSVQLSFASKISLNYRDADIDQVLQFFSLTSGKTIIKDPEVKGNVTIISQEKVSLEEGFTILRTILSLRGYTLLEDEKLIKVVPLEKARGEGSVVVGNLPAEGTGDNLVTQILPLKGLKAADVAKELQNLFPSAASVAALESSNALLLTDYEPRLRQIEGIIKLLEESLAARRQEDRPRLEASEQLLPFRVIRLQHQDAEIVAKQLSPLLTPPLQTMAPFGLQTGRGGQQQTQQPDQGFASGLSSLYQQLTQAAQSGGLVQNQIVADPHTNSVIVTGSGQVLTLISQIIAQIDVPVEEEKSVHKVFHLKYADAQNAVNILRIIFQDSRTTRLVEPAPSPQTGTSRTWGRDSGRSRQQQQLLENLQSWFQRSQQANTTSQQSVASDLRFAADNTTNSVVVTAPESIIEEISEFLELLDQQSAGNTELQATAVIKLYKANASQLAELLNQVLNLSYRWNQSPSTVDQQTLTELLAPLGLDPEKVFAWPMGTQVRVAADVASNSLVVTASLSAIAQLEALVTYLDQEGEPTSSVYVYRLQNARASELAKTLSELFTASTTTSRQQVVRGGYGYSFYSQSPFTSPAGVQNITVVADDVSNSLLITASPQVIEEVKPIIAQLDVMPPQVLIEAVVMEVTLDESTNLGLALSFDLPGGEGRIDWGTTPESGFRYSTLSGSLSATIQALSKISQVDILATPKIATANNKQASINIGHQFPYLTSSREGEDGRMQHFYTYKDVGIKLEVTPRICESGQIALDIYQTSNSLATDLTVEGGSVIAQREAKTSVIVRDGQTMVIGGMIKDDTSQFTRKVPLLGDLPIIGRLFQRQETVKRKTELVVFITPRIVRDDAAEESLQQE